MWSAARVLVLFLCASAPGQDIAYGFSGHRCYSYLTFHCRSGRLWSTKASVNIPRYRCFSNFIWIWQSILLFKYFTQMGTWSSIFLSQRYVNLSQNQYKYRDNADTLILQYYRGLEGAQNLQKNVNNNNKHLAFLMSTIAVGQFLVASIY